MIPASITPLCRALFGLLVKCLVLNPSLQHCRTRPDPKHPWDRNQLTKLTKLFVKKDLGHGKGVAPAHHLLKPKFGITH